MVDFDKKFLLIATKSIFCSVGRYLSYVKDGFCPFLVRPAYQVAVAVVLVLLGRGSVRTLAFDRLVCKFAFLYLRIDVLVKLTNGAAEIT